MRRQPGFAGLAVVTLGVGIGVVTTMFGLLDAVLFRPLPYPDWQRIVVVRESEAGGDLAAALALRRPGEAGAVLRGRAAECS